MWEISLVTVGYDAIVNHVSERRGLLMIHSPYMIIPLSIFIIA